MLDAGLPLYKLFVVCSCIAAARPLRPLGAWQMEQNPRLRVCGETKISNKLKLVLHHEVARFPGMRPFCGHMTGCQACAITDSLWCHLKRIGVAMSFCAMWTIHDRAIASESKLQPESNFLHLIKFATVVAK